jgi:hypothetical protein
MRTAAFWNILHDGVRNKIKEWNKQKGLSLRRHI